MDKFHQFLTELSACDTWYFCFRTITLINLNGFSPNLICAFNAIDIVEIWFGIAIGHNSSISYIVISPGLKIGGVLFHILISLYFLFYEIFQQDDSSDTQIIC